MENVVQIENKETLKEARDFIGSKDDGSGETVNIDLSGESPTVSEHNSDNFREHGGNFENGKVTNKKSGPVSLPGISAKAQMDGTEDFHSHPSGKAVITNKDGRTTNSYTNQFPSSDDITNAKRSGKTKYHFSPARGKVHVYDGSGVIGIIPYRKLD